MITLIVLKLICFEQIVIIIIGHQYKFLIFFLREGQGELAVGLPDGK